MQTLESDNGSAGMTTPAAYGGAPLPKRNGHKGLLPTTWIDRELRLEYSAAGGKAMSTSCTLCDWYPAG